MSDNQKGHTGFNIYVAFSIITTAVFLYPVVFQVLFSFGPLVKQDKFGLFWTSVIFLLIGILILIFRKKESNVIFYLFSGLFLVWIELFFRIFFLFLSSSDSVDSMNSRSNATYKEFQAYSGNPFTQFLGKPGIEMKGSKALKVDGGFNNFGFVGDNFYYYKPSNVIRIACLGESTTADGYPLQLEKYLNANKEFEDFRFEVYNFGHGFWTTNHSLVNFQLNVLDFSPQIVVIHHGWNEAKVRNVPADQFKGDYSHRFKSFDAPFVFDRYIIRVSGIYRYFKFLYDRSPSWTTLGGSIEYDHRNTDYNFESARELMPFKRNMNAMIDIAQINNIKVLLATLPYSTGKNIPMREAKQNIIQCNRITRSISESYGSEVCLVDLDSCMTGLYNEFFVDLAHVTDEGRGIKSKYIGNQILQLCDSVFIAGLVPSDKGYDPSSGIHYFVNRMKNDQDWIERDLQIKADKMNLSLDTVMYRDASYLLELDKRQTNN